MNRWKKSLIVAAVFLGVGITGSIISGIYMVPKVVNEVYRVQREVANAKVAEKEVFITAEEVLSINIESLRDQGFDVEVKKSKDSNTRVMINEYMEDSIKVESTYDESKKELKIVGERSIYNFFESDSFRGFFEKGYDQMISAIVEERNDNSQIIIEVPNGVDINVNSSYSNNLIIKDKEVLKDNLIFNTHYGYVNLPNYNNLKNISIKTGAYIEMDLREFLNAENVNISAGEIEIASKGLEKEYIEAAKLPTSVTLNANDIDIISYIPIGKDVKLKGSNINYETNFKDYGMNVNLEGRKSNNSYNVSFDGEAFDKQNDFINKVGSYSGYIGKGENKDFNLYVSEFYNCEFEHVYPNELELDVKELNIND
ncbi:MAG: hypothetical protein RSA29_07890 [Clostridium sp.]|uniref:hypothetical protein n=1 Tax=Clostridium sp. TaxID=1506 RepID=UPI00303013A8